MKWNFSALRGNLHSHTSYGDAAYDTPLSAYVKALENGLDVLAVTEHGLHLQTNYSTNPGKPDEWKDTKDAAQKINNLKDNSYRNFHAITGFEWTQKKHGHINIFNSTDFCAIEDPHSVNRRAMKGTSLSLPPGSFIGVEPEETTFEEVFLIDGLLVGETLREIKSSGEFENILTDKDIDEMEAFLKKNDAAREIFMSDSDFEEISAMIARDTPASGLINDINNLVKSSFVTNYIKKIMRFLKKQNYLNPIDLKNFIATWLRGCNGNCRVRINDLNNFYEWCYSNRIGDDGKIIVGQFNHPCLYEDSSHFNNFDFPDSVPSDNLKEIMTLCELSSHGDISSLFLNIKQGSTVKTGIGDGINEKMSNEYFYRIALSKGWRLAPTLNEDNHFADYGKGNDMTGIWIRDDIHDKKEAVMEALRNRRTFVSESDKNLKIKFGVTLNEDKPSRKSYFMGDIVEFSHQNEDADNLKFDYNIVSGKKIGKIYLVRIFKSQGKQPFFEEKLLKDCNNNNISASTVLRAEDLNNTIAVYLKIKRNGYDSAIGAPIFFNRR